MRILVTGGAGFIGSHLVDSLIEKDHEPIIIDNLSTGKQENINFKAKFYQVDLEDYEKIKEIFSLHKPEIVYHLAAKTTVNEPIQNPINYSKDLLLTINLLENSRKHNIKHFIFSSTGTAIYGDTKIIPTTEEAKELPLSSYGCSKLAIEKYLNYYNKNYGLKFTSLRYSNVFGPRQNPELRSRVIAVFLQKLFLNQQPEIFGGIQKRDFIYVDDVVRANLLALKDNKSDIYNVGTGKELDIIEVFSKINKYFKDKFEAKFLPLRKTEQKRSCLSYKKIKENLNWKPEIDFDEGLDRTYCWFLKQKNKNEILAKNRLSL